MPVPHKAALVRRQRRQSDRGQCWSGIALPGL